MKAWHLTFKDEVFDEALDCEVEITHVEEGEIIAKVDGFEVIAPIVFKSPHYVMCSCSSKYPCKHEAALIYYIEKHPELLNAYPVDLIGIIDENQLREFMKKEMEENPQLKKDFLDKFGGESVIDKQHYIDKLNKVFDSGKNKTFDLHGIYDIDLMKNNLFEFMDKELPKIFEMREHSFAATLIEKIAEILSDEIAVTYDSWYDLAEELMEYVYILEDSIYLTAEERKSLGYATSEIISFL